MKESTVTALATKRVPVAHVASAAVGLIAAAGIFIGISGPRAQPVPLPAAAPAPAGWHRVSLPNGTAVLSYPPSLRRVASDADAISVGRLSPAGRYLLFLNATPRQGTENLRHWAAFRLSLLRSDEASSAHQDGAVSGVRFRGGTGSCVNDDYVTKIGSHHYEELACLIYGKSGGSVIVAAAPAAQWPRVRLLLERAVAAYLVR
jgi:hypothetical protein